MKLISNGTSRYSGCRWSGHAKGRARNSHHLVEVHCSHYGNQRNVMTSSNGSISCVTGPLCGEFTGQGEFPSQRPVTRSFDVFFDQRLSKRLNNSCTHRWFETPSWLLWLHCNECGPCLALLFSHLNLAGEWLSVSILCFRYASVFNSHHSCLK